MCTVACINCAGGTESRRDVAYYPTSAQSAASLPPAPPEEGGGVSAARQGEL